MSQFNCFLMGIAVLLGSVVPLTSPARGSVIELSIPNITSQTLTGHPLTVSSGDFSLVRDVDTVSPTIMQAVGLGQQSPAKLTFFDSASSSQPVAGLSFSKVLPSSYTFLGIGGDGRFQERDGFKIGSPLSTAITLSGLTGTYPIVSFTLDTNTFSILKDSDAVASPVIALHEAQGKPFATATTSFYPTGDGSGAPETTLTFENALVTSDQVQIGGGPTMEIDTFSFEHITPEPASLALLAAGSCLCLLRPRMKRSR